MSLTLLKKSITFIFVFSNLVILNLYANSNSLARSSQVIKRDISIFPESEEWIGDPMPYFDGENFRIFFLDDIRSYRGNGFHPWSLITSKDLSTYHYEGIVIPHSNDIKSPESALGTGSVIKDKSGLYHAFYTGYNGNLYPKEVIMHATSTDMKTWQKLPEHTFAGSNQYDKNNFRDPFVYYDTVNNEYSMLVTTRKDNTGVIAKYTSKDLVSWDDQGVFFKNDMNNNSNLECPSLIKFNDHWYLSFSDQWPDRLVHYRIYNSLTGKFTKPKQDSWDGNGFYAGRLETDGKNLYVFGWIPTRFNYEDNEKFDWGGNLAVHKLVQNEFGELFPIPNQDILNKISTEIDPFMLSKTSSTLIKENFIKFSDDNYEFVEFDKIIGINKIEGKFKFNQLNSSIGFMFGLDSNKEGKVNIVLDSKNKQIAIYNTATSKIKDSSPETVVNYEFISGKEIAYTLIIDKSVLSLYIDNKIVVSTRSFSMPKKTWGLFSVKSNSEILNMRMYK